MGPGALPRIASRTRITLQYLQLMNMYCTCSISTVYPYPFIRQWYINKLVQSPRSQYGGINYIRTISGPNNENVLLRTHTVHLS